MESLRKIIVLLVLMLSFSCEKYENLIVGTWQAINPETGEFDYFDEGLRWQINMIFNVNSTGFFEHTIFSHDSFPIMQHEDFEYWIESDSLFIQRCANNYCTHQKTFSHKFYVDDHMLEIYNVSDTGRFIRKTVNN